MTRDERLLLSVHRELSAWSALRCRFELTFSKKARERRKRFATVSALLRSALSEPDHVVTVSVGKTVEWKWLVLAALVAGVFFEYRKYTVPVIGQFIREVLRHCGL